MNVLYTQISTIYRFLAVFGYVYLHYTQSIKKGLEMDSSIVFMYMILILYAVIFGLFRKEKWGALIEIVIVLGLVEFYEESAFYVFLLVPLVHFVSSRVNVWMQLLLTAIVGGYVFFVLGSIIMAGAAALTAFMVVVMFRFKFEEISYLHKKVSLEQKTNDMKTIEISSKLKDIEIISKMFVELSSLNEIIIEEKIIQQIVDSSRYFFDAHYACIYIKNNENAEFEKEFDSGTNDKYDVPNVFADQQENLIPKIEEEYIRIPVQYEGNDWAILSVYGKKSDIGRDQMIFFPFTEHDYEILLVYIDQALFKVKHAKLLKKNEYLANNDFLTGVPNRRYFLENLEREVEKAKRGGPSVSMVMLDIDHFKRFNDVYGHSMGDTVLKIVAETLQGSVRGKSDLVGRLGGEEFGIMLYNPKESAFDIAEKIRRRVSRVPAVEQVTISIGIATYGRDGVTWNELYNNADKALYYSKGHGRNQVTLYQDGM